MVLKLPWGQKQMFWTFENDNFQFFAYFWAKKLKPFTAKAKQSVKRSLNPKLIMVSISENGFEAKKPEW